MSELIKQHNYSRELTSLINNVIPGCDSIYISVGYFYFSGFSLIAESLKDKKVKILVGMETDINPNLVRDKYFSDLRENISTSDDLEKELSAYKIFERKLIDGSLEIARSKKERHDKVYIFEFTEKYRNISSHLGVSIVGSSNFSFSGFEADRGEINVKFTEDHMFEDLKKLFDDEWLDRIPLIDKENYEEFKIKVLQKTHLGQHPKPYYMFIRVLNEYFKVYGDKVILPSQITEGKKINLKYQKDAIKRGINIINRHNGVLIADVVGLGKSIIASAIAHNLKLRTAIICPPHLKESWDDYRSEFDFNAKVFTVGKIEDAIAHSNNSRLDLIIVDEVHKFRNDDTESYQELFNLCQGKKVILLSATPFNNSPKDTFNLIKLFQIPTKSTIQTVENLSDAFIELSRRWDKIKRDQRQQEVDTPRIKAELTEISKQIKNILHPVTIRRSRLDLDKIDTYKQDLIAQNTTIPKRADPIILDYELGNIQESYIETLKIISPVSENEKKLICSKYKVLTYVKSEYKQDIFDRGGYDEEENRYPSKQENIVDIIKRVLVKRFESSLNSFSITIDNFLVKHQRSLEFLEKYRIFPVGNDLKNVDQMDTNDVFDFIESIESDEESNTFFINDFELEPNFINDLKNDIETIKYLRDKWSVILNDKDFKDPKIEKLKLILNDQTQKDPNRKLIIFSEYSDTAEYLFKSLKNQHKAMIFTSEHSQKTSYKEKLNRNFDASSYQQENDFDILIATDSIAEGFNLNRAGTVFNYDIPYNPMKVIQRFGRINRISKTLFDELYIYNYFPTDIGESETNIRRIADTKKFMFNSIFGDDTKILSNEEDLDTFFKEKYSELDEEINPETTYENLIYNLREYNPDIIDKANEIAKKVKTKRIKNNDDYGCVIFSKKFDEPNFLFFNDDGSERKLSNLDFIKLFEASKDEEWKEVSPKFDELYDKAKFKIFNHKEVNISKNVKKGILTNLEYLIVNSNYKNYFQKLLTVYRDYDALTAFQRRRLRTMNMVDIEKTISNLKKYISEDYLDDIIFRASKIEKAENVLIIAQEHSNEV